MDTSWWPALVAVVVIALVVALADGWGRSRRRSSDRGRGPSDRGRRPGRGRGTAPTAPPGRPRGAVRAPARAPRPGEIWWAEVPYEDGPGSKDRPCLVLSLRGDRALVAKITSKYHDERPGVIALPPGSVGDAQGRPSFLETDELREVEVAEFRRRVGTADPVVWDQVRHLA
ncbi:type II toxin-antitoxin system PemK/MazF family toxin [Streptomyces solicathayae]|uniref:Type II toxin-antitoxin system PemK/MazF family toxin n=1 Tax=Streptomyces solicathayae TaxID=3081768 RepID=A0ABZ0LZA6_9ACTN|nr:type II toxin-antitoxin system PemK/MazF family toxin [Streptomyces sp. HUAS YS2]WOX24133.1 type II toxin-antitoxin system PemK/MazF family toxin [Streptomyces sp. HUAS YS2]